MTEAKSLSMTPAMKRKEREICRDLVEAIIEAYETHGTLEGAAAELGTNKDTLYNWMLRLGLKRKVTLVR